MTRKFHEFANVFPLMPQDGAEFRALVDDIRSNGQKQDICLHPDGSILDGRNRYLACKQAGIEPRFRKYDGDISSDSLIKFVVSLNLHRRHLESDQRAACAVEAHGISSRIAEEKKQRQIESGKAHGRGQKVEEKIPQPITRAPQTRDSLAELFDTNPRYFQDMKRIKSESPDAFQKIKSGEISLVDHKKQERKEKSRREQESAKQQARSTKSRQWELTANQSVVKCSALITDPPYGILDEPWEPKKLQEFTCDWASRWSKCEADLLAIFFSQRYLWDGRRWLDESLAGYSFQQLLIWHYPNNKSPQNRLGFKQTWEPVYLYRKNGSERQIKPDGADWGDGLNDFDCHVAAVPQSNFNDANEKVHPAQKPVSVMRWLVGALTKPGELVCDPFSGSGTTGIAALQLGRRFHGIEISEEYRELASGRIAAYGKATV